MDAHAQRLQGRFLVIDGPDGVGKSTQLRLFADWLRSQGVAVVETRDPGGTLIGDRIRAILLDVAHEAMSVTCETLLYMASRAQLWHEVIAPALAAGRCVVCDRWVSATVAYQGAGGTPTEDVLSIYRTALPGVWPDRTALLDLPPDVGLERVAAARGQDRMEAKSLAFHRRVREMFREQADAAPDRFAVVDASGTVDEVQQRLRAALR